MTTDASAGFHIDHLYVQYQIPEHPREFPVLLIHGGTNDSFPLGEVPDPIPLYDGELIGAGPTISPEEFQHLTTVPIQSVEGDNISRTPNLLLDIHRIRSIFRDLFVETVNRHGGDASVLRLPDAGLNGNTHFAMADINNRDVFALMLQFLHEKRLDRRRD